MTEKRYKEVDVLDNVIYINGNIIGYQQLCDLLNELDEKYVDEFILRETLQQELQRVEEENKQLKQQINELQFNKAKGQQEYRKRVMYD